MGILYWICEYGKVLFGYVSLIFLWTSVVFWKHLRKKTAVYCFGFCVTVPIVIVNTIVLMLGLADILHQWIVRIVFYGIFVASVLKNILDYMNRKYREESSIQLPSMKTLQGRYNLIIVIIVYVKMHLFYTRDAISYFVFACRREYKQINLKKFLEGAIRYFKYRAFYILKKHGLLAIVLLYGVVYFSYGAFQMHSYGCGDLYIHHAWIQGLVEGKIFTGGVYPEAMHCFIYCMNTLFGVRVYSSLLFLQGIHVVIFLVSAYLFLCWVFRWKYTPIFVIMLFLTVELNNADLIYSMFRMQMTLPVEFGLHTVFLCALFLARYLWKERIDSKYFLDENLFLIMMALSAAAMIHFDLLIMNAIVFIVLVVFALKRILYRKYWIPLAVAGLCAGLVVLMPMAVAGIQGMPIHDSVDWFVSSMDGRKSSELYYQPNDLNSGEYSGDEGQKTGDIITNIATNLPKIYLEGYAVLYGIVKGRRIFLLTIVVAEICFWIKRTRFQCIIETCSRYPLVIVLSFLYVIVYATYMTGRLDILSEGCFYVPGHMMLLAVIVTPVDLLLSEIAINYKEFTAYILSRIAVVGIYGGSIILGVFRGYLFYEMTRYNAAVEVTNLIIDTYPKYSYTIVSPTDELYQVIQHGWHEELLSFVENSKGEEYTIPTENIFIFVEKRPILYAQSVFFKGPWWLGEEKYLLQYSDGEVFQNSDLITSEISREAALQSLPEYDNPWTMYSTLDNRTILESKVYDWCIQFSEQNPAALNTYYEDDDFICYHIIQDMEEELYNLGIGQ